MPAHSGPDPHAHSIPARPKSSSTGRRPNTRSKMSTPVTSAGTGSAGRKIGSRTSTKVDIKQTPPTITDRQENGDEAHLEAIEAVQTQNDAQFHGDVNGGNVDNQDSDDENSKARYSPAEIETPKPATPPPPEPKVFTLEKFKNSMDVFSDTFSQNKYTNVTDNYPVDDLMALIGDVTECVEEYKQQTLASQRHLEVLRERMRDIKERIQDNVQSKSNAIRMSKFFFST